MDYTNRRQVMVFAQAASVAARANAIQSSLAYLLSRAIFGSPRSQYRRLDTFETGLTGYPDPARPSIPAYADVLERRTTGIQCRHHEWRLLSTRKLVAL